MANEPTNVKFQQFREILHRITEEVEKMAIELDASEKVAMSKGATSLELRLAKDRHLADPEIRKEMKARYQQLWNLLFESGTESFADDTLDGLPFNGKPH